MEYSKFFKIIMVLFIFVLNSCRKENTDSNRLATLTMNVNGVPFSTNKANSFISSSNNMLSFATESQPNMHSLSVISYLGNNVNVDYSININTISALNISQALFNRDGNALDVYSLPFISENGYLNYRVVKKQTIGAGANSVKCDINFSGVIYASVEDSVVITNGTIRY